MKGDFQSFHTLCPNEANTETKCIINFNEFNFPRGEYFLLESYCNDKNCDCRKVMINIVSKDEVFATIGFGWEDLKFYEKWIGDKKIAVEMKGPSLELGGMQSKYAIAFLNCLKESLLKDSGYINRLKKHYKLFKKRL